MKKSQLTLNKRQRIPKATQGTQDEENKTKTQHNMCWTPLYANKHN